MNDAAPSKDDEPSLADFLEELGGGTFAKKIMRALKDTGIGTVMYGDKGKTGKVTITLSMKRIGESQQVALDHTLAYSKPTIRGTASETDASQTPLFVSSKGRLSVTPDTQTKFEFDQQRAPR